MNSMPRSGCAGFTLLELIVIISVIGILALVATVRFAGVQGFDSRGFYDNAAAVVRLAQKTAVAWRRPVFVCVTTTQVTVGTNADCSAQVPNPATNAAAVATAPTGVTLNTVSFSFDNLGRASADTTITFTSTIPGDPPRSIVITGATGHVTTN